MNARELNSTKDLRIIPITLSTTYQNLQQVVNAWLVANTKTLPAGKVIQIILNFNAAWRFRDVVFQQYKACAADTDKCIPVYDCLGMIEVASASGSATGTIELYMEP